MHTASTRSDGSDRGTGLGVWTRLLAGVFAVALVAMVAVRRVGVFLRRVVVTAGQVVGLAFGMFRGLALSAARCTTFVFRRAWSGVKRAVRASVTWCRAARRRTVLVCLVPIALAAGVFVVVPDWSLAAGSAVAVVCLSVLVGLVAGLVSVALMLALVLLGRWLKGYAPLLVALVRPLVGSGRVVLARVRALGSRFEEVLGLVTRACVRVMSAIARRSLVHFAAIITRACLSAQHMLVRALQVLVCGIRPIADALWWAVSGLVRPLVIFVRHVCLVTMTPLSRLMRRILRWGAAAAIGVGRLVHRAAAPVAATLTAAAVAIAKTHRRAARRLAHSVGVAFVRARSRAVALDAVPLGDDLMQPSARVVVPFDATAHQNEYLPRDGTEVHAIIEIASYAEYDGDGGSPECAEVILLDCSGSMGHPWKKLRKARAATEASLDAMRDGTWFAIVRATQCAEQVYPRPGHGLAQASDASRQAARVALRSLCPEGGTAMGQWLLLARSLLATRPRAIKHAILLTDGRNESENPVELDAALAACEGSFQCDCRGVGTDWEVAELRMIASRLLGTVDLVAQPDQLATDLRAMTRDLMAKAVAGVTLRLWAPRGANLRYLKQVWPEIRDLTAARTPVDHRTGDYPTGSWGTETRQYHLCIDVPLRLVGDEMLAARVSVVVGGKVEATTKVRAVWTDDEQLSTRLDRRVFHYTGQAELADAIAEGLEARRAGDRSRATDRFGRAAQLAAESRNEETLRLLQRVVDMDDPATGVVRLRDHLDDLDEMALDTRSTRTVPISQSSRSERPVPAPQQESAAARSR